MTVGFNCAAGILRDRAPCFNRLFGVGPGVPEQCATALTSWLDTVGPDLGGLHYELAHADLSVVQAAAIRSATPAAATALAEGREACAGVADESLVDQAEASVRGAGAHVSWLLQVARASAAVMVDLGAEPPQPGACAEHGQLVRPARGWTLRGLAETASSVVAACGQAAGWVMRGAADEFPIDLLLSLACGAPARLGEIEDTYCGPPLPQVTLFLRADATSDEVARIQVALAATAGLDPTSIQYVSSDEAYAEFQAALADSPELVASVEPDSLPASFRTTIVDPVASQRGIAALWVLRGVDTVDVPAWLRD